MKINKDNWIFLILNVFMVFMSLVISNIMIERLIKQPFKNSLTDKMEDFNSPVTIIFFCSGIVWISSEIFKLCASYPQQKTLDDFQEEYFGNQTHVISKTIKNSKKKDLPEKQQRILLNSLPRLQILKIVATSFASNLCFLYGVSYLSFSKVMIFKILSKIGLLNLYESLFQKGPNRLVKFTVSLISFVGFGLFNYSFVDSAKIQENEKLYRKQVVYGSICMMLMSYLSLAKEVFQKKMLKDYGKLSSIDKLILQGKGSFILAYLTALFLQQEIYGSVFAIIHNEFIQSILVLGFMLLVGGFCKKYIQNNFSACLSTFISFLQKHVTLIISLVYAGNGVYTGEIVGLSITIFMGFVNFTIDFVNMDQNDGIDSKKTEQKKLKFQLKICISRMMTFIIKIKKYPWLSETKNDFKEINILVFN